MLTALARLLTVYRMYKVLRLPAASERRRATRRRLLVPLLSTAAMLVVLEQALVLTDALTAWIWIPFYPQLRFVVELWAVLGSYGSEELWRRTVRRVLLCYRQELDAAAALVELLNDCTFGIVLRGWSYLAGAVVAGLTWPRLSMLRASFPFWRTGETVRKRTGTTPTKEPIHQILQRTLEMRHPPADIPRHEHLTDDSVGVAHNAGPASETFPSVVIRPQSLSEKPRARPLLVTQSHVPGDLQTPIFPGQFTTEAAKANVAENIEEQRSMSTTRPNGLPASNVTPMRCTLFANLPATTNTLGEAYATPQGQLIPAFGSDLNQHILGPVGMESQTRMESDSERHSANMTPIREQDSMGPSQTPTKKARPSPSGRLQQQQRLRRRPDLESPDPIILATRTTPRKRHRSSPPRDEITTTQPPGPKMQRSGVAPLKRSLHGLGKAQRLKKADVEPSRPSSSLDRPRRPKSSPLNDTTIKVVRGNNTRSTRKRSTLSASSSASTTTTSEPMTHSTAGVPSQHRRLPHQK